MKIGIYSHCTIDTIIHDDKMYEAPGGPACYCSLTARNQKFDVNLATKYNIKPSIFANAFVNDRPFVTSNIIGATSMDQLKENIDSASISLSNEILDEIQDIHLSDPNPCV